jgi:exodeoxyribonuclease VII small subunit
VLQQHAQTLRNQSEPNIDDLLTIVTESVDAYKVCQQRIDAVEKALEKALGESGAGANEARSQAKAAVPASSPSPIADDDADDIPF